MLARGFTVLGIVVAAVACAQTPPSKDAGGSDKDVVSDEDSVADASGAQDVPSAPKDAGKTEDVQAQPLDVGPMDAAGADVVEPDMFAPDSGSLDASTVNDTSKPQVPYNPSWSTKTEYSQIPPVTVKIPKGTFWMGCTKHDPWCDINHYPQVKVTVSAFEIAKYETTLAQYHACVVKGPCTVRYKASICESVGVGPPWIGELNYSDEAARWRHPEHCVSWEQARTFCKWLGKGWDLPTEVQWVGDSSRRRTRSASVGAQPWACRLWRRDLIRQAGDEITTPV